MLPLGILASAAVGLKHFITKVTGASSTSYGGGVYLDTAGEVLWSYYEGASPYYSQYTTISPLATYGVSTNWTNSSGSPKNWSIRKYGTNVYQVTFPNNLSSSCELLKTNSAGSKVWSRSLTLSGTSGGEIALDSSENVYLVTKSGLTNTGNNKWTVAKYNSSGTIQWQKALQGDANCNGWAIATTSAGDVYTAGSQSGNTTPYPFVFKLDTSGTKQFVTYIASGGATVRDIVVDSSGNFYLLWTLSGVTYLSKGNSSGAQQWTRQFGSSALYGYSMAIDPSGNIYIICGSYSAAHYVAKYNSSGTIQWQRSIASSSGYMYAGADNKIYANADSVVFTLQETGNSDPVLFKMPANGTLTGTYAMGGYNYTWASSSQTDASYTITWSDFTAYYSANSGSATDAAGSVSPATYTPTTTTKVIP